jgi:hypothetical protein
VNALADMLALTRNMFAAAHSHDYDRVLALDGERRAMLESGLDAGEGDGELIGAIFQCDRELVAAVEHARKAAAERLREARLAQAGVGSYLGVAFPR